MMSKNPCSQPGRIPSRIVPSGGTSTSIPRSSIAWICRVCTEFVVLLAVAPNRRNWLFKHPLELAIVLLTPPFGPAALQSARAFRLLRLLRLLRVAKLGRSLFSLDGIKWAALIAFLLIEACGVGLVVVEGSSHQPHLSIVDGLWWAMTTVTTIGYGDITPLTTVGRLIAMCIMIVGLGFVAVLTGAIAQHFISKQAVETQIASTNDVLAAVHDVKAEVRALSDRVQQLETRVDRPAQTALVRRQTRPLRRAQPPNRGGRTH